MRWWPENHVDSRARFMAVAKTCGASLCSYPIDARGPAGESLSTDTASMIADDDRHRLVVISGVHGVEGFVGAAIQVEALCQIALLGLPTGTGLVMIHAANPWGYAHLRRVDENNVDLNRNFLEPDTRPAATHPDYAALDPVINPATAPGLVDDLRFWSRAARLIVAARGLRPLAAPIASGQVDFPKGLFYGGLKAGASVRRLQGLIREAAAGVESVTVLDIHTGLGPSATATLIANTNLVDGKERREWLATRYDNPIIMDRATDNAYTAEGSLSQWCEQALGDRGFLYLCVEIGTVNPLAVLSALRRENQAHHHCASDSDAYLKFKHQLRDAFSPPSTAWREKALTQGLAVFKRSQRRRDENPPARRSRH